MTDFEPRTSFPSAPRDLRNAFEADRKTGNPWQTFSRYRTPLAVLQTTNDMRDLFDGQFKPEGWTLQVDDFLPFLVRLKVGFVAETANDRPNRFGQLIIEEVGQNNPLLRVALKPEVVTFEGSGGISIDLPNIVGPFNRLPEIIEDFLSNEAPEHYYFEGLTAERHPIYDSKNDIVGSDPNRIIMVAKLKKASPIMDFILQQLSVQLREYIDELLVSTEILPPENEITDKVNSIIDIKGLMSSLVETQARLAKVKNPFGLEETYQT